MRDVVNMIDDLDEADAEAVRKALGPRVLEQIARAQSDDWLDAELMVAIDAALFEVLGPAGFDMFWIGFASQAARAPKLRSLATGIIRIFVSPKIVVEQMVKSYGRVTRGLGSFLVEFPQPEHARVTLYEMGQLSNVRLFAMANRACFIGALRLAGRSAKVDFAVDDATPARIVFDISW